MDVVVNMLSFLNPALFFSLSSHGALLNSILPVCPKFHSLHTALLSLSADMEKMSHSVYWECH